MKTWISTILFIFCFAHTYGQDTLSTSPFVDYKSRPILFIDLGYNAAPFSASYPFDNGLSKIKYRHNFKTMLGFGFSYKWFSLRLGAALIGNVRPISRYGSAKYYDFGVNFTIKKTYSEIDLRGYSGYVIKDAYRWVDTLNELTPNDVNQKIQTANIALKMWYFDNKNFKMNGFNGIKGTYTSAVTTWYLAGRFDYYGVSNEYGSILPTQLYDSTNSKTASTALTGLDIGVIPGVGHVNKVKNFQYGAMFAFGPRIQFKTYNFNGTPTTLLGIVGRYDIKLIAGYNPARYFALFTLEFDNKTIRFNDLKYKQSFYAMRLTLGYRFKEKTKQTENL